MKSLWQLFFGSSKVIDIGTNAKLGRFDRGLVLQTGYHCLLILQSDLRFVLFGSLLIITGPLTHIFHAWYLLNYVKVDSSGWLLTINFQEISGIWLLNYIMLRLTSTQDLWFNEFLICLTPISGAIKHKWIHIYL